MNLNKKIDLKAAKKQFSKTKRVQIPDILDPAAAETLNSVLVEKTAWMLNYNLGSEVIWREMQEFRSMTSRSVKKIVNKMYEAASTGGFQFVRHGRGEDQNPVNTLPLDPGLIDAFKFLKSKEMTDFLKKVTGKSVNLKTVEAQWYKPENFQTRGSDMPEATLGFVLLMAKNWVADWGGNTYFYDDEGGISEIFVPKFNSLEIFEGKAPRSITDVSQFSKDYRVSIAGSYS